ncbi:MAG: hypothetical protein H6923_08990 [Alphaproteobacteria bacterium]|nr:hypothetical protein [Alphaproteobacteria bacterium]
MSAEPSPVAKFYLDRVEEPSFRPTPPRHGAIYWSGEGNRARAEAFAREMSMAGRPSATLEMTPDGYELDQAGLFNDPTVAKGEARQVWAKASDKYAVHTEGNVNTFVVGSSEQSYFRSTELPRLLQNERVTAINGIPRERLAELAAKDPDRAYGEICSAELARDRLRAHQLADRHLLDDVEGRAAIAEHTGPRTGRTHWDD